MLVTRWTGPQALSSTPGEPASPSKITGRTLMPGIVSGGAVH
jgi:hypothetical protein